MIQGLAGIKKSSICIEIKLKIQLTSKMSYANTKYHLISFTLISIFEYINNYHLEKNIARAKNYFERQNN